MIANPTVPAFRFDPYAKKFTRETYEHGEMRSVRGDAVRSARRNLAERGSESWAVLLGTLGRQGSLSVLKTVQGSVEVDPAHAPLLILLSELSPQKLALFSEEEISTFVQTSCPRLSIDWGYAFSRPLLSPYEASVAAGRITGWDGLDLEGRDRGQGDYPMDFYAVSLVVCSQLTTGRKSWTVDATTSPAQAGKRHRGQIYWSYCRCGMICMHLSILKRDLTAHALHNPDTEEMVIHQVVRSIYGDRRYMVRVLDTSCSWHISIVSTGIPEASWERESDEGLEKTVVVPPPSRQCARTAIPLDFDIDICQFGLVIILMIVVLVRKRREWVVVAGILVRCARADNAIHGRSAITRCFEPGRLGRSGRFAR